MALAVTESELHKLLSEVSFTKSYGFRLHSIGDGECVLAVPFQPAFERPGGIVSGQVFMAAADVAMWLAIMTKLGKEEIAVTVEMKTNFLNGARREDFLCRASILKLGNSLVYGVAECTNGEGKLLTHHTITYIRPDNKDAVK
ncbi:MAG: PaaI family thioesterase [Candidatus Acidiferrales bacterium]